MEPNFHDMLTEWDRIAPPTSVLRGWIRQAVAINDKQEFMIRGGSYANVASNARCANRIWRELQNRFSNVGFRPARTIR